MPARSPVLAAFGLIEVLGSRRGDDCRRPCALPGLRTAQSMQVTEARTRLKIKAGKLAQDAHLRALVRASPERRPAL